MFPYRTLIHSDPLFLQISPLLNQNDCVKGYQIRSLFSLEPRALGRYYFSLSPYVFTIRFTLGLLFWASETSVIYHCTQNHIPTHNMFNIRCEKLRSRIIWI
jgi:hypothetical protein